MLARPEELEGSGNRAMMRLNNLDQLIGTFTRDREFCEALAMFHPAEIARLLVYANWTHAYIAPIQEDLHVIASRHFPQQHAREATLWTLTLTAGVARDLLLVPYFVLHGVASEAGFTLRRSLENIGVLAHLWNEPSNSACLDSPDSQKFKRAFCEADNKESKELKARAIQKRFQRNAMPEPLSRLYRMLSAFSVHGGSLAQLASAELVPTAFSCALLNRPDPARSELGKQLRLLGSGCEMLCIELVAVHGTYGKQYGVMPSKGGEGGLYLTKLLESQSNGEMAKAVSALIDQLGWRIGGEKDRLNDDEIS